MLAESRWWACARAALGQTPPSPPRRVPVLVERREHTGWQSLSCSSGWDEKEATHRSDHKAELKCVGRKYCPPAFCLFVSIFMKLLLPSPYFLYTAQLTHTV